MKYIPRVLSLCVATLMGTVGVASAAVIQLSCVRTYPACHGGCGAVSFTLDTAYHTVSWIETTPVFQEANQRVTAHVAASSSDYRWTYTFHYRNGNAMPPNNDTLNRATLRLASTNGNVTWTSQCTVAHNQI